MCFRNLVQINNFHLIQSCHNQGKTSEPSFSKLMTSLVKVLLKFQMLISEICQYFLLEKCVKLL